MDRETARRCYLQEKLSARKKILHLIGCFSTEQCENLIEEIKSPKLEKEFERRHGSYATNDLPVFHLSPTSYLSVMQSVREGILPFMARNAGLDVRNLYCKDLFFVKYKYESGQQNALELHRDGALLSFNVLLSKPSDFDGGGTYFEHIDKTICGNQGDCICHDSQAKHAGVGISRGERIILVGFVEHLKPNDQVSVCSGCCNKGGDGDQCYGNAHERTINYLKSIKIRQHSRVKNQMEGHVEDQLLEEALSLIGSTSNSISESNCNMNESKDASHISADAVFCKEASEIDDIYVSITLNRVFDPLEPSISNDNVFDNIVPNALCMSSIILEETDEDIGCRKSVEELEDRVKYLCNFYESVRMSYVEKLMSKRSRVVISVKPTDGEIDLEFLMKFIQDSVNTENGVQWGEMRTEPFVFGLRKIIAAADILESVALQSLIDEIEALRYDDVKLVSSAQIVKTYKLESN